jgi:predicted nucleic acid-binding protein
LALDTQEEANALHGLIFKYRDRMDLADASIVRLSELHPRAKVLTVDKADFKIYRRFGREHIPCEFPPG